MTAKDPTGTRRRLLEAAFATIHRSGFQAASLDVIQREAKLTRGALYHHFADKRALGLAVVDELIGGRIRGFAAELAAAEDPLAALRAWIRAQPWGSLRLGCPLNNLAQEMSPVDEGFRRQVDAVFEAWIEAIAGALRRARTSGRLRRDVDTRATARFVLAALEGSVGLAKSAGDDGLFHDNMRLLDAYLGQLAVEAPRAGRARRGKARSGVARPGARGGDGSRVGRSVR